MKNLARIALIFASSAAFAAGPIDGIYSCTVTYAGRTNAVFLTINGHDDGRAIWSIPAVAATQSTYGYGIGQISESTFSGTTMDGAPFSMQINGNTLTGKVGEIVSNTLIYVDATCNRFW